MMPVKGLDPKELVLPKKELPAWRGIYFSAIALSMWDNIHGPKILQVWQGPPTEKDKEEPRSRAETSPSPKAENTDATGM